MRTSPTKALAMIVGTVLTAAAINPALPEAMKPRQEPRAVPSTTLPEYKGTPIIMQGLEQSEKRAPEETKPAERVERPRKVPRGSSTYIPPPVPSPGVGSPPAVLLQPPPQPYKPPPIKSFGDRVIECIHSYPLNKGIGNNPMDQQMYIRQCAN